MLVGLVLEARSASVTADDEIGVEEGRQVHARAVRCWHTFRQDGTRITETLDFDEVSA
jgi:hypothetical protein